MLTNYFRRFMFIVVVIIIVTLLISFEPISQLWLGIYLWLRGYVENLGLILTIFITTILIELMIKSDIRSVGLDPLLLKFFLFLEIPFSTTRIIITLIYIIYSILPFFVNYFMNFLFNSLYCLAINLADTNKVIIIQRLYFKSWIYFDYKIVIHNISIFQSIKDFAIVKNESNYSSPHTCNISKRVYFMLQFFAISVGLNQVKLGINLILYNFFYFLIL